MSIYRHTKTLLHVTTATDQNQDSGSYTIIPKPGDGVSEADQRFKVFFDGKQTGGAGTPTTDIRLLTSHDKSNWIVVASITQLTGTNGERHELADINALGPYVKAVSTTNGSTKPTHTVAVVLASNSSFDLKSA